MSVAAEKSAVLVNSFVAKLAFGEGSLSFLQLAPRDGELVSADVEKRLTFLPLARAYEALSFPLSLGPGSKGLFWASHRIPLISGEEVSINEKGLRRLKHSCVLLLEFVAKGYQISGDEYDNLVRSSRNFELHSKTLNTILKRLSGLEDTWKVTEVWGGDVRFIGICCILLGHASALFDRLSPYEFTIQASFIFRETLRAPTALLHFISTDSLQPFEKRVSMAVSAASLDLLKESEDLTGCIRHHERSGCTHTSRSRVKRPKVRSKKTTESKR